MLVYLYLNKDHKDDKEILEGIDKFSSNQKIYFSGAYNQIHVFQVRAEVIVKELPKEDENHKRIINLMKERLMDNNYKFPGTTIGGSGLEEKKGREEALKLLEGGRLFVLTPVTYSLNDYERG